MFGVRKSWVSVFALIAWIVVSSSVAGLAIDQGTFFIPARILAQGVAPEPTAFERFAVRHGLEILAVLMIVHYAFVGIVDIVHLVKKGWRSDDSVGVKLARIVRTSGETFIRVAVPVAFCAVFYLPMLHSVPHHAMIIAGIL